MTKMTKSNKNEYIATKYLHFTFTLRDLDYNDYELL